MLMEEYFMRSCVTVLTPYSAGKNVAGRPLFVPLSSSFLPSSSCTTDLLRYYHYWFNWNETCVLGNSLVLSYE